MLKYILKLIFQNWSSMRLTKSLPTLLCKWKKYLYTSLYSVMYTNKLWLVKANTEQVETA